MALKKSPCIHLRLPTYETPVRFILAEGLWEHFDLTDVRPSEAGQLNIYLEEKTFHLQDINTAA